MRLFRLLPQFFYLFFQRPDLTADRNITGGTVNLRNDRTLPDHSAIALLIAHDAAGGLSADKLFFPDDHTRGLHAV